MVLNAALVSVDRRARVQHPPELGGQALAELAEPLLDRAAEVVLDRDAVDLGQRAVGDDIAQLAVPDREADGGIVEQRVQDGGGIRPRQCGTGRRVRHGVCMMAGQVPTGCQAVLSSTNGSIRDRPSSAATSR